MDNNPFIESFFGKNASENLEQTGFFHKFGQQVSIAKNSVDFRFRELSTLIKPGIIMFNLLKLIRAGDVFDPSACGREKNS